MQDKEVIKTLQNQLNYSEKNISDIKIFINDLLKANKKHNFISKSTENVIWQRHILDSAQLVKFIDFSKSSLADLGSGAGFPGLVIAFISKELRPDLKIVLVEKNKKKAFFLNEVVIKIGLNVEILSNNVE